MSFCKSFMYMAIGVSVLSLTLLPLVQHLYTTTSRPVESASGNAENHPEEVSPERTDSPSREGILAVSPLERDDEEIALRDAQIHQLRQDIIRIQKEALARQESLKTRLEASTLEVAKLRESLALRQTESENLETSLAEVRATLADRQGEMARKLQSLTPRLELLEKNNEELQAREAALLEEQKTHQTRVTELEAALEIAREGSAEVETLKVSLEEQQQVLAAKEAELQKLQEEKAALAMQSIESEMERTRALSELEKIQEEHQALVTREKELSTARQQDAEKIAQLTAELEKVRGELTKATEELAARAALVQTIQETLSRLDEKVEGSRQSLADEIARLLTAHQKLEAELVSLKGELVQGQEARRHVEELRARLETLTSENTDLKSRLARAEAAIPKPVETAEKTEPEEEEKAEEPEENSGPLIEATIAAVDHKEGLVVIDKGIREGITKGMKFWVHRDGSILGRIEVRYLQQTFSGCTILVAGDLNRIQLRDRVQTHRPTTDD